MRKQIFQILVYCVTVCFTLHSLFGCSSSKGTTADLDNYKDEPYVDDAAFRGHKDDIYKAAIGALQSKGYLITASDTTIGLLTAQMNRTSVLPEDRKDMEETAKAHGEGHNVILRILGIIFLFGIIDQILHSISSHDGSSHPVGSPESTANSFTYIISISMAPIGSDSTAVKIEASRTDFENGNPLSTTQLSNKYLNYSIFDAIDEKYKTSVP